jgi:hypothetical protein
MAGAAQAPRQSQSGSQCSRGQTQTAVSRSVSLTGRGIITGTVCGLGQMITVRGRDSRVPVSHAAAAACGHRDCDGGPSRAARASESDAHHGGRGPAAYTGQVRPRPGPFQLRGRSV